MVEANTRYQSIVQTTPDMVVIMDAEGFIVAANPAVERILGYKPEELIGQPLSRLMPERYREQHRVGLKRYLETRMRRLDWKSIQLPALDSEDCEVPLDISFGEFLEDGQTFFTGIMRDIRVRKKAEDTLEFLARLGPALAGSELDYRKTLAALARLTVPHLADWCAIDVVGEDGGMERVVVVHEDAAKVEVANELRRRYPPRPDAVTGVTGVIRSGKSEFAQSLPRSVIDAGVTDDEHRDLILSLGIRSYAIVPLISHGQVYGALSLVQGESRRWFTSADMPFLEDVGRRAGRAIRDAILYEEALETNRRLEEQAIELEQQKEEAQAMAEELEAQTQELTATSQNLEAKTAEAEEANRAKSEFLATMSHELRTPLNAIGGYVDLLLLGLRGANTPEQAADLERIKLSARHLLGLINDVLNYAKIDAGSLEYDIRNVDVLAIVDEAGGMVMPQITRAGIEYDRSGCTDGGEVRADREKLRQILLNLMSNAIRFTPSGGRVSISCEREGASARISVTDTGIGIPADLQERIFEPFVQVDRTLSRPGQGAGLGLSISRNLARGMGGDLTVTSADGKGAVFTIELAAA